ncbi:hypothetical protein BV20DRAFT_968589 [Pilatotrama ljubarskyi]|nr:hypothetical protein BV20DRAFT_968589 [Pilatotrama ljubarskyi]
MPRDASPPELSPLERTALWVQAQAEQTYEQPSPPLPARASIQTSSSYRTTSSDESYAKSPLAPIHNPYAMPAASVPQRPRYDSRSRRSSLPFPQSPPGSGYPVPLEVASPRRVEAEDKKTPRPSIRKQRRPSLIDQIISLGAPSQRRREDSGRRGQT